MTRQLVEDMRARSPEGVLIGALSPVDPPDPPHGVFVIWMTPTDDGDGNRGDILLKATFGGITKTVVLLDFSSSD
jgi:hypothetical protein